ncbi:MAG: hypothetical protein H7330_15985 [Hymenobacteraceae bacterium]|nr:hypothetical protein [Hymenobacteraceae bacterium]
MIFIELLLLLLIVGRQAFVFYHNRQLVARVGAMYPERETLAVEVAMTADVATGAYAPTDLLTAAAASPEFVEIISDTNEYLQNNKGAAADFNILKDISERRSEALDDEIQAQLATPLYLGLAGTFGGAILGLIPLFLALSDDKLTSPTVSQFLGGVLIAMIGSLFGLVFTLWGNQLLKVARARRDRQKNGYYTFLQKALLPKLNSDMQASMGSLKAVLDTFNQDFFGKIQTDFFSKISQLLPLVGKMTENIVIQKDFLDKLQSIGYTELANSTIRVFDRVEASAQTFEKFLGYQQALNQTLQRGTEAAGAIDQLLRRMTGVEEAARLLPTYLSKHDDSLNLVLRLLTEHQTTLKNVSDRMTQRLDAGIDKMDAQLDQNLVDLDAKTKEAHLRYQAWFQRLNADNVYQRIVEYLDPIKAIPAQQIKLNDLQEKQSRLVALALERLEQRLDAESATQRQLAAQVQILTEVVAYQSQPWHKRFSGFKPTGGAR